MNRKVFSSLLFGFAAISIAVYGLRPLLFPSPEQVVIGVEEKDAQGVKSEQGNHMERRPQSGLASDRKGATASAVRVPRTQPRKSSLGLKLPEAEPYGRVERSQNPRVQPENEEITYESEEASAEELHSRAMELQNEAVAYFKQAVELSEKGSQRESMEYEREGLDLESKANDFIAKAEKRLQEARDHDMRSMEVLEGHDGEEPWGGVADTPPGVEPLRQEAQMLLEQARAHAASAIQSREMGDQREAMEYEQMALELESEANDALQRADEIFLDFHSEEMRKRQLEVQEELR